MEVRDEILDLIQQVDRHPTTEVGALEWLLLLQWIERDFYVMERNKPKMMDRPRYLLGLRQRQDDIRVKAIETCPSFTSIKQYTLLTRKWADLQNVGISIVPGSGAQQQEKPPEIVAEALTNLVANHMNFSRGYAALSWPRNNTRLEINMVEGKPETEAEAEGEDDAGQQEEG